MSAENDTEKETPGIRKAFKYRLYPTSEQQDYFNRVFGCCQLVYNHFLETKIKAYGAHKEDASVRVPTLFDMSKMLTEFKRETAGSDGELFLWLC